MAKYLHIQIPKGCEESWDAMTQQHNGKFCNSCQKAVIDFTGMNDDQLIQFFKRRKENVCGRFTSEQLNTDIHIPAKRIPWLKYFFTITIPAFLVSSKAIAQINIQARHHSVANEKKNKSRSNKKDINMSKPSLIRSLKILSDDWDTKNLSVLGFIEATFERKNFLFLQQVRFSPFSQIRLTDFQDLI